MIGLCGQVPFIQLHNDVTSWHVLGNELRLGLLLNGKLTGLWEPELLLVGRGSNTYFMQKYDNKCRKCIWCCYSGFFCNIISLNVKMYLWLKLYTVPFFVSGQTYKISKGSNNYCSHCMWKCHKKSCSLFCNEILRITNRRLTYTFSEL